MLFKRRSTAAQTDTLKLYYASDVHGSEHCWRKFLGAGKFYKANALVMGGDLTGKAIVPIEMGENGEFRVRFMGEERGGTTEQQLNDLMEAVRYNGMYPWLASAQEIERHRDDADERGALFESVMAAELQRWIDLADERMAPTDIQVFVMPGNDDPWVCDQVLDSAKYVVSCGDRIVKVGNHEMVSCAYANPTPWHSPRELDEDALYARMKAQTDQLEAPHRAILNLHVPPYNSGLDRAREIDETLSVVYKDGQAHEIPVGSHAVRQIIEEVQPLVSLHGHIHESRGDHMIGRTLAVNSGSEYNTGRIHGVLVSLADDAVVTHQFVVG